MQLAKRQLAWLTEKILADRANAGSSSLSDLEWRRLDDYIDQRTTHHKPLQYILGTQPFYDLDILTRPPTLIPRWETEEWTARLVDVLAVHWKQHKTKARRRILDVCTGSGCIGLGLAAHLAPASTEILGVDIAPEAVDLARANLARLRAQLNNNDVQFECQDIYDTRWLARHLPTFDLVVANPPYVTHDEYAALDPDVKLWEDRRALVADQQGTHLHRHLIRSVAQHIPSASPSPRLVMEIGGEHQVSPLSTCLETHGFENIQVWNDLAGRARVILAS
ncbi:S-adenosyl-L-methionine-dependent methyltransferase [Hesseltinella vesiculosa]|uniref:peptide chain release factor N(5)-glutamine methyltransferase n=1 Tax=Hesseltinella vesiculosa TaxID=101127 RepID=A0A1X2GXU6_9FUNG|nr:S-adenosyl-L-methionine-dependent methyltransferase [Hesseltinella vesiculosa]